MALTPRSLFLALGLVLGVAGGAPRAQAHAIESSLERLSAVSDALMLESRFGSGEPARDAVVRLQPPGGEPIEVGRTDADGRLRFTLPAAADAAWEVQVDGGPGHRDYLELPAAAAPGTAAGSGPALASAPGPAAALVARPAAPPWRLPRLPWAGQPLLLTGLMALGGWALIRRRGS